MSDKISFKLYDDDDDNNNNIEFSLSNEDPYIENEEYISSAKDIIVSDTWFFSNVDNLITFKGNKNNVSLSSIINSNMLYLDKYDFTDKKGIKRVSFQLKLREKRFKFLLKNIMLYIGGGSDSYGSSRSYLSITITDEHYRLLDRIIRHLITLSGFKGVYQDKIKRLELGRTIFINSFDGNRFGKIVGDEQSIANITKKALRGDVLLSFNISLSKKQDGKKVSNLIYCNFKYYTANIINATQIEISNLTNERYYEMFNKISSTKDKFNNKKKKEDTVISSNNKLTDDEDNN